MAQASAAANRILSLRSTTPKPDAAEVSLVPRNDGGTGGVKIEFRNVYFKYPTRDVPVFTGLNFSVGGREHI